MEKIAIVALLLVLVVLSMCDANAASGYKHKDNAGYTHYYNSRGHQTCVSKKDAAGYTHYNCDDED